MNDSNFVQKFIWLSERAILLLIALATIYATASEVVRIIEVEEVNLSDLFLLFIYAEVLGMVATFYANNRIPVTLPLIIAMTALTRMIILQTKDLNAVNIIYEATGILILAISAYIMTLKDKISSYEDKIQKLELALQQTANAPKVEPNPDTGEIPLRTGLANALLDKDNKNKPEMKGLDKKKLKMSLGKSKVEINPDVEIGVFSGGKQTPSGNLH